MRNNFDEKRQSAKVSSSQPPPRSTLRTDRTAPIRHPQKEWDEYEEEWLAEREKVKERSIAAAEDRKREEEEMRREHEMIQAEHSRRIADAFEQARRENAELRKKEADYFDKRKEEMSAWAQMREEEVDEQFEAGERHRAALQEKLCELKAKLAHDEESFRHWSNHWEKWEAEGGYTRHEAGSGHREGEESRYSSPEDEEAKKAYEKWKKEGTFSYHSPSKERHREYSRVRESGEEAEQRWRALERRAKQWAPGDVVAMAEIPFPTAAALRHQRLEAMGKGGLEAFFRTLILRWHPDKFQQRYGCMIREGEAKEIFRKVNEAFQLVDSSMRP